VVSVLVVENDVLLLEAAANANVEMLVPPAVLMDSVLLLNTCVDGVGVVVPVIL